MKLIIIITITKNVKRLSELYMDIKAKIKDLMQAKNMSSYSLAQAADLSQTCISNWYGKRGIMSQVFLHWRRYAKPWIYLWRNYFVMKMKI